MVVRNLTKSVMFSEAEHKEIKELSDSLNLYIRQVVMLAVRELKKRQSND